MSRIHRFPHYECANAVGAAIAQVAGSVDSVESIEGRTIAEARVEVEKQAIRLAIEAGARPETVKIIESESIPVAYTVGRCRFFVKAAGEWGNVRGIADDHAIDKKVELRHTQRKSTGFQDLPWTPRDIDTYKPDVRNGEWRLSEIDIEWIATGAFIMGCGGGGSPFHTFLGTRELIRAGHDIIIKDLISLADDDLIGWGGGMGSPEVASERLLGDE